MTTRNLGWVGQAKAWSAVLLLASATGCEDLDGAVADEGGSANGPQFADGATAAADPSEIDADSPPEPDPSSSEIQVNPFVATQHDPLSTFAIDVDTASYDLFRQYMSGGTLPPANAVRLEEFVNYFAYDYPRPAADAQEPFEISLAAAPGLIAPGTTLLRVGIQGKPRTQVAKRPTNLVFLVDTSFSMEEEQPLVRKLLSDTLAVLDPSDRVSIVIYASATGVVLTPTAVAERSTIEAAIKGLQAGGSTAGSAGLQLAYEQAEAGFIEGGINHVVLCTDGDFNVGPSSNQELLDQIVEQRKSGVTLTALGFGFQGVNDDMLELVSNAGNGIYGVITDEAQAEDYVQERLLQNLTYIAKDVKIQVEFNPARVQAYRLLGYEDRAIADEDFREDLVDAGEIGAGHRVTAIYELVMSGAQLPEVQGAPSVLTGDEYGGEVQVDADALVRVKVRYKRPDAAETDSAYETFEQLHPDDVAGSHEDLDLDFQWAVGVAAFAEVLRQSPYASPQSLEQVEEIVDAQRERDEARAEFGQLFSQARGML